MKSRIVFFASLFCSLLALPVGASSQIRVVATTSHIGDIVRNVAGDAVELSTLMGAGVDPHLYKATARDVIALRRADLILYNGLHLEGALSATLEKVDRGGRSIVAVAEAIPAERLLKPDAFEGAYDPHVWFDPELWGLVIDRVVESLVQADAAHEAIYRERGQAYKRQVVELKAWSEAALAKVPQERRALVTSHDAYNYFGRVFGIEVVGVQGISTAAEAGLADIAKMGDFIRQRGIPAIFVESSVSPATIRRISESSGAKVGGELFSDALGRPGEWHVGEDGVSYDVGTYIGMFKANVDTIVRALR